MITPIERLERLLDTLNAIQGEDSEYSEDVRVAMGELKKYEDLKQQVMEEKEYEN